MAHKKEKERGYNLLEGERGGYKKEHVVPGLRMDCFLETNLFDLPHECAAHFVLWTVTIFYHLFSFPCRALGKEIYLIRQYCGEDNTVEHIADQGEK